MLHKERNKLKNNNFKRKNPRLKNYDYTLSGYYFITLCTKDKINYFGEIRDEKIKLNNLVKFVYNNIKKLEKIYRNIKVDKFVVMPNHIHLIIIMEQKACLDVSRIIKEYKEWITKKIKKSIWQKSYYDHIIRNKNDYLRIWQYIDENIIKWNFDKYYSD